MKKTKVLLLALLACAGIQAQELVDGKNSLNRLEKDVYEITKEDGTKKTIDLRPNVEEYVPGILSVLFKDCEEVRVSVFEMGEITEPKLIGIVKNYNNCNLMPFEPTEKEVRQSNNFQGDKYKLFASVGAAVNRTSFFNFDDYENLTQGQLSFGLAATPGFIGSLQGNLYVTLEVNAAFSGDKDFENSPFETNFKKDSQKASLGLEYHFNKNGTIRPLLGIGIGLVSDHYKGNYNGYKISERDGSGLAIAKLGVLFSLDERKSLGVILSYIPEYENDLSFWNGEEIVPLTIDTHYINAGLYLYF